MKSKLQFSYTGITSQDMCCF